MPGESSTSEGPHNPPQPSLDGGRKVSGGGEGKPAAPYKQDKNRRNRGGRPKSGFPNPDFGKGAHMSPLELIEEAELRASEATQEVLRNGWEDPTRTAPIDAMLQVIFQVRS